MNRVLRDSSRPALIVSLLSASLFAAEPAAAVPRSRPNVVLILADDLGIGDPRCYNPDSKIPTPSIDRLAAEGLRFDDAHSPSAVCTPTRYGLLTGRYSFRSRLKWGVLWGDDRLLIEPGRETIPSMLKRAGYATALIGKWHLGLGAYDAAQPELKADFSRPFDAGPHSVGFETVFGIPSALDIPPYVYIEGDRVVAAATELTTGSQRRWAGGGGFWRSGPIAPGFSHEQVMPDLTRRAVSYLERQAADDDDRPFFLLLSLAAPHTPWVPTKEFLGKSGAGYYGDFVVQIDATVGAVLEALERTGQADDTLCVFTSDNGSHWRPEDVEQFGHDAHLGYRGMKADIYEAGHRIPLVVRWPGQVAPGSTNAALIGLNDFYRTLAELVGHPSAKNEAEDSISFLSVLKGGEAARKDLVLHSYDGMFALRLGPWKLIAGLGSGGFSYPFRVAQKPGEPMGQLYDLSNDRSEQKNLYSERPQLVQRLLELLKRRVEQN